MATRHALRLPVADLLKRPGSKRDDTVEAVLDGLAITPSRVPEGEPVRLDMHLESVNEGIVLTGTVSTTWDGECRRCLRPVRAPLRAELLEVFEGEPTDGETRPLEGVLIDLEPVAREAVLLELPLAPLCRDDCAGLCPQCGAVRDEVDCGHRADAPDPRWSALDDLRFED